MKLNPTHLSGALLAIVLLQLVPATMIPKSAHIILGVVALLLAASLLIVLVFLEKQGTARTIPTPREEPSRPALSGTNSAARGSADAEVIAFLGRLQDKGRFVDFLMDDISGYRDEEVGQAARVVYEGCRSVMKEHLTVEPLHSSAEGSRITVPEGYRAADYQLSGRLKGEAPFQGTLVHRGWKVTSARFPKVMVSEEGSLPNLAPAQVEV